MTIVLLAVHILCGAISLISGTLALSSRKGGKLHRRAGIAFAYAMVSMTLTAGCVAIVKDQPHNIAGASLTLYLVITGTLTVRKPSRQLEVVCLLFGVAVAIYCLGLALLADAAPVRSVGLVFGGVAALAITGDLRKLADFTREGALLARHLWRMCFAMFIATASFFLGQAMVFPDALRMQPFVRAIPVIIVIAVMIYWLIRVRSKRVSRVERAPI